MNRNEAIALLNKEIVAPESGLPEEVFLLVSRLTPMANVDLLVKDENGRTLLAWRDDKYAGRGWHLPGGIIRFKEKVADRIMKVAETEIGERVEFDPAPLALNEIMCAHDERGHFISILFKCSLPSQFVPKNAGLTNNDPGFLKWHETCPGNLIKVHKMYRRYI
jgi:colanic acid biosynthesis protein WcaH